MTIITKKQIHSKSKLHSKKKIYKSNYKYVDTDKINNFINNNLKNFENGKIFNNELLNDVIFNSDEKNCICNNIFKQHINDNCNCNDLKTYKSQGKSGASIHSLQCNNSNTILKVMKIETYYLKLRTQTHNYKFIECDKFTLQTLINTYVYNELPNNTVKLINSGICQKNNNKDKHTDKSYGSYYGYNLMNEADLGDGFTFINNLINDNYITIFNIKSKEEKYNLVMSFLLQTILIIGHLQYSSLEFFHGDFKPDNVFVKLCDIKKTKYFNFNINEHKFKLKNLGFSVLIADFDLGSITINNINSNINSNEKHNENSKNSKVRIVPPIEFKFAVNKYVNNMIKNYGDSNPDTFDSYLKIKILKNLFISKVLPRKIDPIITILRASGIRLYKDFDLYIFFIKLLNSNKNIKNYIINNKIDDTILSFMSSKFKKTIFLKPEIFITMNETSYLIIETYHKLNEPMNNIFTQNYIKIIKQLCKLNK